MTEIMNQIDLSNAQMLTPTSYEIVRVWVQHRGNSFVFLNAATMPDPGQFGRLMADVIHHGAVAYGQLHGTTPEEAARKIWAALDSERGDPTGDFSQIHAGGNE